MYADTEHHSDALGTAADHQLSNNSPANKRQTLSMLAEQFIRSTELTAFTAERDTSTLRVLMIHTRFDQAATRQQASSGKGW